MTTGVYEGSVRVYGGLHAEGEELRRCQVSVLGDTAKLSKWFADRGLFRQVDFLDEVKLSSTDDRTVFTGRSRQLIEEVGVEPGQAEVRWEMAERRCAGCR